MFRRFEFVQKRLHSQALDMLYQLQQLDESKQKKRAVELFELDLVEQQKRFQEDLYPNQWGPEAQSKRAGHFVRPGKEPADCVRKNAKEMVQS